MKTAIYCFVIGLALSVQGESPSNYWDLLVYTQRYPVTVCMAYKAKNHSHTCSFPAPSPDVWTIHGIWPTKFGSIGPLFCNRSWPFDPQQIKPIEGSLINLWTNVEKDTSQYSFWAHEWTKHGTCAAVLEPLNSEYKYFNQGLKWLDQYTMSKILNDAGIVPSDDKLYNLQDIRNAIIKHTKVDPVIECHKEKGRSYLFELRICFKRDLSIADCDGIVGYNRLFGKLITNCDPSLGIIYPLTVKEETKMTEVPYVQLYKLVNWLRWMTF